MLDKLHENLILNRRVLALSQHFVALLPQNCTVLDIGCGDGKIAKTLIKARPDIKLTGIDTLVRKMPEINTIQYDGKIIPFDENSFDFTMLVDVIHHAEDPFMLIKEAARVSKKGVLIKDHLREGIFANATLAAMDWVGNARHGVALPYTYWNQSEWNLAFAKLKLKNATEIKKIGLYPFYLKPLFERNLHFISLLEKQ